MKTITVHLDHTTDAMGEHVADAIRDALAGRYLSLPGGSVTQVEDVRYVTDTHHDEYDADTDAAERADKRCLGTRFAAIGSDGTRPVVWGLGDTEQEARDEATSDPDNEHDELRVVKVSAKRAARIEAGDVDASDLWT